MTPLTPTEIAEMQADALAGTPGPWRVDGPVWSQIVWTDSENRLCFMAHSNGLNDDRDFANARRIARVPRLEATVTAQAAEIARLREAAQAAIDALDRDTPFRSADFHREDCQCCRCKLDWLRAALEVKP